MGHTEKTYISPAFEDLQANILTGRVLILVTPLLGRLGGALQVERPSESKTTAQPSPCSFMRIAATASVLSKSDQRL